MYGTADKETLQKNCTQLHLFLRRSPAVFLIFKPTEIVQNILKKPRAKVVFPEFMTVNVRLPNLFSEHVLMK